MISRVDLLFAAKRVVFAFLVAVAPAMAADLSRYRDFTFGAGLPAVAKQVGAKLSEVKVVHSRPSLIQQLSWRPPLMRSSGAEPVQEVVFSFQNGELFRVAVEYDRYQTEGLTVDDIIETISAAYGAPSRSTDPTKPAEGAYGNPQHLATWEDAEFRFDLTQLSWGPGFKLIGVKKRLEAAALTAILEATRLDEKEAPQRDAARILSEEESSKEKLDKARAVNKPKFRP
jgi:hypothetical protein